MHVANMKNGTEPFSEIFSDISCLCYYGIPEMSHNLAAQFSEFPLLNIYKILRLYQATVDIDKTRDSELIATCFLPYHFMHTEGGV